MKNRTEHSLSFKVSSSVLNLLFSTRGTKTEESLPPQSFVFILPKQREPSVFPRWSQPKRLGHANRHQSAGQRPPCRLDARRSVRDLDNSQPIRLRIPHRISVQTPNHKLGRKYHASKILGKLLNIALLTSRVENEPASKAVSFILFQHIWYP